MKIMRLKKKIKFKACPKPGNKPTAQQLPRCLESWQGHGESACAAPGALTLYGRVLPALCEIPGHTPARHCPLTPGHSSGPHGTPAL